MYAFGRHGSIMYASESDINRTCTQNLFALPYGMYVALKFKYKNNKANTKIIQLATNQEKTCFSVIS